MAIQQEQDSHVNNIANGLRGVEKIDLHPDTFITSLLKFPFLGHGSNAIIFGIRDPLLNESVGDKLEPFNIIRLPLYNILGKQRMNKVVTHIQGNISDRNFLDSIDEFENAGADAYCSHTKKSLKDLVVHTAAANINFRKHPGLTIPINSMLCINGLPFATFEKRIVGRHPSFESEYFDLEQQIAGMGGEYAPGNIFFDVSPYFDENGVTQYVHPLHVIDFKTLPDFIE